MGTLDRYWKKRNFAKTAEPQGKSPAKRSGASFTVQKHAASVLHYDFRIELDGVLKSWAVPKGPSLDPQKKRLAVHVEDHPVEYGTFEGTIPAGQYGGGTVVLWDRGTWEPIGDPHEGYAKGRLKFKLHGVKLKGIWNLIRIKAREGGGKRQDKAWLLIKERDEEAISEEAYSIIKEEPGSVRKKILAKKSEKKEKPAHIISRPSVRKPPHVIPTHTTKKPPHVIPRLSARKPLGISSHPKMRHPRRSSAKLRKAGNDRFRKIDLGALPGIRRGVMPEDFQPELATLVKAPPIGDQWLSEVKFDGYRLIARVENGDVSLITRNGKDWTRRFPDIAAGVAALNLHTALLDGEVVAFDAKGRASFQALQNRLETQKTHRPDATPLGYFVFDLIHYQGYDLREVPLLGRKEVLRHLLDSREKGVVRFSDHIVGAGAKTFDTLCKNGGEGMIAKRADSLYREKRTTDWIKVKCGQGQEFIIGGYVPSTAYKGNLGALLLGYHDESGNFRYCGKVGTGFNDAFRRDLTAKLDALQIKTPAFVNPPKGFGFKNVKWTEPQLIAQISFTEWTNDGNLRHPSFQGLREDKSAPEVSLEKQSDASATVPQGVTHPERVLFPESDITKGDLAAYLEKIAPRLLPFVRQRPLSLVRCPQGTGKKCFFQRNYTEGLPSSLSGVDVSPERDGSMQCIVLDDAAGLIALAQLGSLEIHPWGASVDDTEHPDHMTFDLDPGQGITWKDLVDAAMVTRQILEKLGLQCFIKTTGGKGLHVVVPLNRKNTWDEVTTFTKALAEAMARFDPSKFVAVVNKAQRRGKIYVDYLRNVRGATSVAPYSPRAREGATVSMPLSWSELKKSKDFLVFDITSAPLRLKSADPWKDYFKVKQNLNAKMTAALHALGHALPSKKSVSTRNYETAEHA